MKLAATVLSLFVVTVAAAVTPCTLPHGTNTRETASLVSGAYVTPTAVPATWIQGLRVPRGPASPLLLSCLDANGDGRLNGDDGSWLFRAIDVRLVREASCGATRQGADFYESAMPPNFNCERAHHPVFLIVVGSAGTDLLDASAGESLGLLDVINEFYARATPLDVPMTLTLSSSAIAGAEMGQSNLDLLLSDYLSRRLDAVPCARAALVGHSHGGVAVTSVASALERRYASRLLGVVIDRTNVMYDRPAEELPTHVRLLNFFQTNEGWHGVPLDAPNIINYDESLAVAPVAPSDGGGGRARVRHRSLDDAPEVQQRIADALVAWATSP